MSDLFNYAILLAGASLAALCLNFAYRLVRADSLESKKCAARQRSTREALLGKARLHHDWMPDARIKGGMIFNRKAKRIEISGRLSDDSVERVFHR